MTIRHRSEPRRSVTGSLSFAFWRDRMGNFVQRPDVCDHAAWSGGEGPIVDLGRWPVLWKCDGCGLVEEAKP